MSGFGNAYNSVRVRLANATSVRESQRYVLYWMQIYRRLHHNHALDYACAWAESLGKPLVIFEGLRFDYRWASVRHHRFLLEGMQANARLAAERGIHYWPFVATPERWSEVLQNPEQCYQGFQPDGRGLLRHLSRDACLVVTDDWPCYVVPEQTAALASKVDVAVHAIDGNSIVPLNYLGDPIKAAAHLRPRIHREFAEAWRHRAHSQPEFSSVLRQPVEPSIPLWDPEGDLDALLARLPIDQTVPAIPGVVGGDEAGRQLLRTFVQEKVSRYATGRNQPEDPSENAASQLSPYLRSGHLSIQEVVDRVLQTPGHWDLEQLNPAQRGKREGFYSTDENVNSFLDEAITWRDVGQQWHWHRRHDVVSLERALPDWAKATLNKHAGDPREYVYSLEDWEAGNTHDALWNAAQRELVATGRIHNYLRMLWGKKVLEWSTSPEQAYEFLEHMNNKYAIDGRDPNSYTGILWCFGLFDRPWPPERKVFGTVRYMSSENTARKYKLAGYYRYIDSLPTIADVWDGKTLRKASTLFS